MTSKAFLFLARPVRGRVLYYLRACLLFFPCGRPSLYPKRSCRNVFRLCWLFYPPPAPAPHRLGCFPGLFDCRLYRMNRSHIVLSVYPCDPCVYRRLNAIAGSVPRFRSCPHPFPLSPIFRFGFDSPFSVASIRISLSFFVSCRSAKQRCGSPNQPYSERKTRRVR